jgi:hypothetical protein
VGARHANVPFREQALGEFLADPAVGLALRLHLRVDRCDRRQRFIDVAERSEPPRDVLRRERVGLLPTLDSARLAASMKSCIARSGLPEELNTRPRSRR